MPQAESANEEIIYALRKLIKSRDPWRNHAEFAADLLEFSRIAGYRTGLNENIVTNIISRKKGANPSRIKVIIAFLRDNNIHYDVEAGEFVEQGDLIGHPSCEGGLATGTHVHITRKYNGEWILADGPLPFELGGWVAQAGTRAYQGALVNGDKTVLACSCASSETYISR